MSEEERLDVGGIPSRSVRRPLIGVLSLGLLALAGCSATEVKQLEKVGLPAVSTSDRAPYIQHLWVDSWIAAGIVGVIVWTLILWAALHYRRRDPKEMPRQSRYNLPMEVMYTIVPFVIIGVLFYFTIIQQDRVLAPVPKPDYTINVVGQKWAWTFNYKEKDNPAVGQDV